MDNELIKSWARTESYLRDARSHLSESAESVCSHEIQMFDEYLRVNELELALDMLDDILDKSIENFRVVELMALAAASMKLFDRQWRYDKYLSNARGWDYHTSLPDFK